MSAGVVGVVCCMIVSRLLNDGENRQPSFAPRECGRGASSAHARARIAHNGFVTHIALQLLQVASLPRFPFEGTDCAKHPLEGGRVAQCPTFCLPGPLPKAPPDERAGSAVAGLANQKSVVLSGGLRVTRGGAESTEGKPSVRCVASNRRIVGQAHHDDGDDHQRDCSPQAKPALHHP